MPNEDRNIMSSDIFTKFNENRELQKIKKAKIIFNFYSKNIKYAKKFFFEKWKKNKLSLNNCSYKNKQPKHQINNSKLE